MQTVQRILVAHLHAIVNAIFDQRPVVVKQAYSDFDCPLKEFSDANAMLVDLRCQPGQKPVFSHYAVYYPEAKGYTFENRISLKPKSCDGHTFRYALEGWGLIHLRCDFRHYPTIECRIAVNSEPRADN